MPMMRRSQAGPRLASAATSSLRTSIRPNSPSSATFISRELYHEATSGLRLELERKAGDEQIDLVGDGGEALVGLAEEVTVGPPDLVVRHDAQADLVGDDEEVDRRPL